MRCPSKDLAKSWNNRYGSVNFWIHLGTLFKNTAESTLLFSTAEFQSMFRVEEEVLNSLKHFISVCK